VLVTLDYRDREPVAAMVIGGMTVAERVLREAARSGARRAVLRGDGLPALPALPLDVAIIPASEPLPGDATAVPCDVVAGVQIADESSRSAASRALFQACRRPYDGIGDRYVIRSISLRLSSVLCRLGATPNQVTMGNIVIGLVACVLAARGMMRLAGVLMFAQVVLDSCDGELARIRHLSSQFGMWLDNTSDDVIDNLFVAMLGVGIGGVWMPIGIAAACARSLTSLAIHIAVARQGKAGDVIAFRWWLDKPDDTPVERFDTSALGLVRAVGRRDLYVLLWAATCIAGIPLAALLLGAAMSFAYFVLMAMHIAIKRGL
jgi:phosphatidylglycerophosphate synthase